jgi:hypothetical protein
MNKSQSQLIWGVILVVGGFIFLLQTLGIVQQGGISSFFWSLIFGFGGLVFIYIFGQNREHWWSLIPGLALLSVGSLIMLEWLAPRLAEIVGGSLVLGGISLAFWLIYANDRQHWWAVIPGGVLLTLAAVSGFEALFRVDSGGFVFFLGLAATFGFLSLLPGQDGERMRWPLFPALGCLALALLTSSAMTAALSFIWPLVLIAVGAYLLLRPKTVAPIAKSAKETAVDNAAADNAVAEKDAF